MRLQLIRLQPSLLMEYGLRPWELESYTTDELDELIRHHQTRARAVQAKQRQQAAQARQTKRR